MNVSNAAVEEGVMVMSIEGRLDAVTTPELDKIMSDKVASGQKKLLLDLSKLEYMSSAGMRLVLAWAKKLQGQSGKLVLSNLVHDVEEVIKMAGFHQILCICPDKKAAMDAFKS